MSEVIQFPVPASAPAPALAVPILSATATPTAVTAAPAAVPAVPEKPLTAIQFVERDLANLFKRHLDTVAQVHSIEGAIQSAQRILGVLKSEEAKAAAFLTKVEAGIDPSAAAE